MRSTRCTFAATRARIRRRKKKAERSTPSNWAHALCGRFVLRVWLSKMLRSTSPLCEHTSAPSNNNTNNNNNNNNDNNNNDNNNNMILLPWGIAQLDIALVGVLVF